MFSSALSRLGRARGRFDKVGHQRHWSGGLLFAVLAVVASSVAQCTGGVLTMTRVDLKVLVINDGPLSATAALDNNTQAIIHELQSEGVPYREINLNDVNRPTIDAAFLSQATGTNPIVDRSFYQAVVVPTENPTSLFTAPTKPLLAAEFDAVKAWEIKFGIRQLDASTFANVNNGMAGGTPTGTDGLTATVSAAGLSGPFSYLTGSVPFDAGSYAYPGTGAAVAPATFTPLVNLPSGTIVGTYANGGREEMVITTNYLYSQTHFQLLGHGIITWLTKGVHLGYDRAYFTMHTDDVFGADARWSTASHCTPGEDCPAGVTTTDIRMNAADVTQLVNWQTANNFKIVQVYNGFYANAPEYLDATGHDALTDAYVANRNSLQWINHTYTHQFLGCVQDFTTIPWKCVTTNNVVQYVDQATIVNEIDQNKTVATTLGLPIDPTELVTGEHSGMYILPQQPADNPNLAAALTQAGIKTTAADASRQPDPRTIGSARTVPRHPINIFFNTATKAEAVSEYNWIFTSAADGGSGICTANNYVCIAPVNATTGFTDTIIPNNTKQAMQFILGNDPRPTYAHVTNLTEDRVLYPQLEAILGKYRGLFNANAPIVSQTQTAASASLDSQYAWNAALANNQVEAYTLANVVYVSVSGGYAGKVAVTAPGGTKVGSLATGPVFGEAYAGDQSAWISATGNPNQTVLLLPTAP